MIAWWLRHDRRLSDNSCWEFALEEAAKSGDEVKVFFAWNRLHLDAGIGGIPRMSARRIDWTQKDLQMMRTELQKHGINLEETEGSALDWLKTNRPSTLTYSFAVAHEERQDEAQLKPLVKRIQGFWTHSILEPDSIPGGLNRLPEVFTPFRHKIERENLRFELPLLAVEPNLESPTSSSQAFPFEPGEASALARLGAYMNNPEGAAEYKTRRNGLLGTEYSTKFSPWLASGALSPRRIWQACLNLEESLGGSPEVEWIRVELLWREYFQWVAYRAGSRLFSKKGSREQAPRAGFNARAFQRWVEGRTGDDFVNAGMQELAETGYSSNRARQNLASYLIHDLGIDWRYGAAYFESQLLDYDPASNWANWAYLAGVGNDPRPVRRFNTVKQAQDYDANRDFRQAWLHL
jgi:deoxyribodipyrimidine photo-lyase